MQNNSIVPFIKKQFPQHIADSDSLLVPFMEAYYEWMQQPTNIYDRVNDLGNLSNIDKLLEKFTEQFSEEFLKNIPKEISTDKALTIKHINDLYKSKGTPNALKLLIRIVLGKESEVFLPSSQILRASDGEWVQSNSVLVKVLSGDIFDIVGQTVKIATGIATFPVNIARVKLTEHADVYEVFIENKIAYTITERAILSYNSIVLETLKTVNSYKIIEAGSGFKIGQIIKVDSAEGSGTVVKVKSVTPKGGITSVEFLKFGYGYNSAFRFGINSSDTTATPTIITGFPTPSDTVAATIDSGYVVKYIYTGIGYMDEGYTGDSVTSFNNTPESISTPYSALIEFNLGVKLKYPGYYSSVRGFLSNNIYLHDNYFYQMYSYVIKVDELLSKYKPLLEQSVHPAGLKMFGEYSIKNNFNLNTQLRFILNFFRQAISDSFSADDINNLLITKPLVETLTSPDANYYTFQKILGDSNAISESEFYTFTKVVNEVINVSESSYISLQQFFTDIANLAELPYITTTKNLNDNISVTDNIILGLLINKYIDESVTLLEAGNIFLNYYSTDIAFGDEYWINGYSEGITSF